MSQFIILDLHYAQNYLDAILTHIAHIHASCIEHDHTEATFIPPLSYSKIITYWQARFKETQTPARRIWVELQPIKSRNSQLTSPLEENKAQAITFNEQSGEGFEVAGVVALSMPDSETGPFRGVVEKLLVSPNHRQKGVAKRLMSELERFALSNGRWNLMLDTEVGSPAESVYPRLGFIRVGTVPDYGYSPVKGKMVDEVWFYKDLKKQGTL